MLAYFPTIYPGELLYSVLARYHRHVGSSGPMHTLEELFGNRKVIATFDLPGHLQALAQRIPSGRGLSVDRIIDTLTLYRYFAAFEPPHLQAQVRQALQRGETENLHVRLGLAAFRVGRIASLRFCPDCSSEMHARYGELYWRRDHQLPSVLVCPEHGCPLLESAVCLAQHSRHEFVAATRENCPPLAPQVVAAADQSALSQLHQLARMSVDLLDHPPVPHTFAGWTSFYRSHMQEIGFARSSLTMDQQRFDEEFRSFYGQVLEILPNVLDHGEMAGDWLAAMVRNHRKAMHPLYHLLVQGFLEQRGKQFSPFGDGPWPCLNPLAQHRTLTPIESITVHSNHGKTVGVFACSCGYVYTRCFDPITVRLGAPRFLRYGPLLEPALRESIEAGSSLRGTGLDLRLDPKTVVRLARALNIAVPWKTKPSGEGRTVSRSSPRQHSVQRPISQEPMVFVPSAVRTDRTRRDWAQIDHAWATKLKSLAEAIRAESPPVRVTITELEHRAGRRGWLLNRPHRLPLTMAFLNHSLESVEDFQVRRIHWAITELERGSAPVKAWRVMRKAGLRSSSLDRINSILQAMPTNNYVVSP